MIPTTTPPPPQLDEGLSEGARREEGRGRGRAPAASLREALLGRVVLSGGSSAMPGLPERLRYELSEIVRSEPPPPPPPPSSGGGAPPSPAARARAVHVYPSTLGDHTTCARRSHP